MPVRNVAKILAPRSVAIIGASERPGSVGGTVLANLTAAGTPVEAFPVNPKHAQLAGRKCYSRIGEIPKPVDLAIVCTPAATVPEVVRQCGAANVRGLLILSAGFRETGAAGAELESQVAAAAREFDGLRVLGPNCLGFMAPHLGINASFVTDMPPRGSVAFVSQSGALCSSILDWAQQAEVGFSYFVSLGNMLDVSMADTIDFLAGDPHTTAIILYIESLTQARQFMSAARAFTRTKPIIAYKAGRFAESAKAAASHTGALAGVDSVYEAALARAGVVRVFESDDLFGCAQLLSRQATPRGDRLAIVTNAGGPGVMATDALLAQGGKLAELTPGSLERLSAALPASWSHGNPIDVIGDAPPERISAAARIALSDPGVDGLLVILSPQAMTDPTESARVVAEVAHGCGKPVLAAWMGGARVLEGRRILGHASIPVYSSPEQAIRAFSYLVSYARRRESLYETPRDIPLSWPADKSSARSLLSGVARKGGGWLSEIDAKSVLGAYGIPVARTVCARTGADAVAAARALGFPVALKILSPQITHKTEVGGVELNLTDPESTAAAFARIVSRARAARPDATIEGVVVEPMIADPHGRELIVGMKRDPVFGAVLLAGSGGIAAEVLQDRALQLPPLSERLARRMLQSLRIWPLLGEFRGRPAVKLDAMIEALLRFSQLVVDCPEIEELDINPLLATPTGVTALDARIRVRPAETGGDCRPFSHLVVRPYPVELVARRTMSDGRAVVLRPIRPEDEPLWMELVASCSPETLHQRFRYMFKAATHEMATRFCYIDYDRELAIVAEVETPKGPQLVGVVRLVSDADRAQAEYAILVADAWQGHGLGTMLTDYALGLCRERGLTKVVAETAADNARMISMFVHRGFAIVPSRDSETVRVQKNLTG